MRGHRFGIIMYRHLLNSVTEDQRRFRCEPQPPCTDTQLERLAERAMAELAAQLPEAYQDFLRLSNGLDWNGVVVFASERVPITSRPDRFINGFVEMNL